MRAALWDATRTAGLAALLTLPLLAIRLTETAGGLGIVARWDLWGGIVAAVWVGRLLWCWRPIAMRPPALPSLPPLWHRRAPWLLLMLALVLPVLPATDRYVLDVGLLVLTYLLLALGLNITVGMAGMLDLGFVAFYALGAYGFGLLASLGGLDFWASLPLAALLAAGAALLVGYPVLRLRGDYLAIVTLGFGEITRIIITNWGTFTGGPNGLAGIPRPSLFGYEFTRGAEQSFHALLDLPFSTLHRIIFLYYVALLLVLLVWWLTERLRCLPLGRAWEAIREDDIAAASLGLNRTRLKLAAYALAAAVGGVAGAFFAARQGFISPESFTFMESAMVLAIVVLGGMGRPLGITLAALFLIAAPEMLRELADYRMLAFGAAMVLIMIWRPGGLMNQRQPAIRHQP